MSSLARGQPLSEERERRRIAVEIHDHLSQNLALIKMKLGMLRARSDSAELRKGLEEVAALLDPVLERTRSLTFELSPPVLYELGLDEALEWLAEQVSRRHGIRVTFQAATPGRRNVGGADEVTVLLFQATRELLANAVKHARARHVTVRSAWSRDAVTVTVADDGRGFNASKLLAAAGGMGNGDVMRDTTGEGRNGRGSPGPESEGFGLFSIRARMQHLGGRMDVSSARGAGTEVTLSVPLDPPGGGKRSKS